ncbi:MAG: TIGR04076 family protein [Chloroflexota bacterium]
MPHPKVGFRVIGTIKSTRGTCMMGHKVGEVIELDAHDANGLCGFFFYQLFPYILMLQFGGKFPDAWGGEVLEFDCIDKENAVTIQLRREKA